MTFAERGFFHHCLDIAWANGGLPADPAERARVLRVHRNQADALWGERVSAKFVPCPNRVGYLDNTRGVAERQHAQSKSLKAAESAKAKSERSARASDSDSDSVSVVDSKKETSLQRDDFSQFLEACETAEMRGSETDIKAARSEWGRLSLADRLAACAGIRQRLAAGELADPGFRPLPQNYLKNRIWQRTVRNKHGDPALDKQHAKRNEVVKLARIFGGKTA